MGGILCSGACLGLMMTAWAQHRGHGAGGSEAEGSPGIAWRTWGVGISGGCSIQVAPAVGTNPCLSWFECEELPAPWDRQRPWPWDIAFWGVEGWAVPPGAGRVLGEWLGTG